MKATNGQFEIDCICENCAFHCMKRVMNSIYLKDLCVLHDEAEVKKAHTCSSFELSEYFKKRGYKII